MNTREEPFINAEMRPGESLVWVGQPDAGLAARVGLPLSVIALLIGFGIWHDLPGHWQSVMRYGLFNLSTFFCVIQLLFVVPLLPLAFGPLWLYQKARQTYYAISDKRVLIFKRGSKTSVSSYERDSLTPVAQFNLFGRLHLLWYAPGFYRDGEGDMQRNKVFFAALPNDTLYKIGIEFPAIASARQLPPK